MNVIFIGYRGSGKTALGKLIARRLKRRFVDVDDVIVKIAGKNIPRIFAEDGEPKFRELETACIKKVCMAGNLVIAFGGGAVMNQENVRTAKKTGKIILLIASPEAIYQRIKSDSNRPKLVKDVNKLEEIKIMLEKRDSAYKAAADAIVKNEGKSIRETAKEIEGILGKMGFFTGRKKRFLHMSHCKKKRTARKKMRL